MSNNLSNAARKEVDMSEGTPEGQKELRRLAVRLAKELGTSIAKLVPSISGVCITFASDVPVPGVIV